MWGFRVTACRYLIRNEYINIPHTECDMAIRSLVYLSMPDFDIEKSSSKIDQNILQGTYAFVDYAVCFWAIHLECAASELDIEDAERLQNVAECLESFLNMHWAKTDKIYKVSDTLKKRLMALQFFDHYDRVCQIVSAAKSWLRPTAPAPTHDDVLRLPGCVAQIRETLERLVSSSLTTRESRDLIIQHNGPNSYKCTKFNCQFFYQGFLTDEQRKQHISKHERAFTCPEPGCFYYTIGFTKAKELKKHVFDYHGIAIESVELEFPDESQPEPKPVEQYLPTKEKSPKPVEQYLPKKEKPPKPPKIHECNICSKTYTRSYNLESHMRTHTNQRPFTCTSCHTSFARRSDLNRHEGLHSGEKKFVCEGELRLQPGIRWGCGKRFSRSENLTAHYRSEIGQRCIRPLREEEAAEQRILQSTEQTQREDLHEERPPKKIRQWEL